MRMLGQRTFTVTRDAGHWGEDGEYVADTSTLSIVGSIQPLTPVELTMLPEGEQRDRARGKVYTRTPLVPVRPFGAMPTDVEAVVPPGKADRITMEGFVFEVLSMDFAGHDRLSANGRTLRWSGAHWNPQRHYKYVLLEVRQEGNP